MSTTTLIIIILIILLLGGGGYGYRAGWGGAPVGGIGLIVLILIILLLLGVVSTHTAELPDPAGNRALPVPGIFWRPRAASAALKAPSAGRTRQSAPSTDAKYSPTRVTLSSTGAPIWCAAHPRISGRPGTHEPRT